MIVKRYLNNVPINGLEGQILHDEIVSDIISDVRNRINADE